MPSWQLPIVLGAAAVGLGYIALRRPAQRWPLAVFVTLCVVVTALAAVAPPPETDFSAHGAIPKVQPSRGYVSSAVCKKCHPGAYDSWKRTYHRTMTQVVRPETVLAPFDGTPRPLDEDVYRFVRRDDRFYVEIRTAAQEAAGVPVPPLEVVMSTGSHHYQIYWVRTHAQTMPAEMPLYWNIKMQRWIPKRDTLLIPPGRQQWTTQWNVECIRCHSLDGLPGFDPERQTYISQVSELGISCEACHGPGDEHVRRHQNPLNRYGQLLGEQADSTIVNPSKLPADRSSYVCGRCHGSFVMDMGKFVMNGFSYRPGGDLLQELTFHDSETMDVGPTWAQSYWDDGTWRIGGDEMNAHMKSPCFTAGELACVSCHSMHDADPNDQLAKGMEGDHACTQCHKELAVPAAAQAHTHHRADSSGARCYNCHMPHTTWALNSALRTHRISSPSAVNAAATGHPDACSLCHTDKPLSWTARTLTDWYSHTPLPPLSPSAEAPESPADSAEVSAAVRWLLSGDAMQRSIVAWHLGWPDSLSAAGNDWQAALLAYAIQDPYAQVRLVAGRSLSNLPSFAEFPYDFLRPAEERPAIAQGILAHWQATRPVDASARPFVLVGRSPDPPHTTRILDLIAQRDDRPISIPE